MIVKLCAGVLLAVSASSAAYAYSTVTMQDRQQAACYNDVQKLCGDLVPDVDKVKLCMEDKKDHVSAGCAKFYDAKPAG